MRWEWYTDEAFELRPLWRERVTSPRPGKRLAQRPPLARDAVRYGFDGRNRPVVMEEYSGFLGGRRTGTTTRTYGDDVIEEVAVDADGALAYTDRYEYADGLLRRWSKVARAGHGDETYHYTDGRVTGIDVTHGGRPTQRVAVSYDGAGRLERIETTHLQGRTGPARSPSPATSSSTRSRFTATTSNATSPHCAAAWDRGRVDREFVSKPVVRPHILTRTRDQRVRARAAAGGVSGRGGGSRRRGPCR